MGTTKVSPRANKTFEKFKTYLQVTGLDEGIRIIIRRHAVSLGDIYHSTNANYPTRRAARLEVWWWLYSTKFKSQAEIAEIFGVTPTTVLKSLKKLRQIARDMQKELNADSTHELATVLAIRSHKNLGKGRGDAERFRKPR